MACPASYRCRAAIKIAGRDWAANFVSRYPELSLRKPEVTSMSRLTGFNSVQVGKFFQLLKSKINTLNITSEAIYNIDEPGITSVQVPGKIFHAKEQSK